MTTVTVVSAFPAGRGRDAADLAFEYMAAMLAQAGHGMPAARTLMSNAHHHAARNGMTRLILDVLPARTRSSASTAASAIPKPGPSLTNHPSR